MTDPTSHRFNSWSPQSRMEGAPMQHMLVQEAGHLVPQESLEKGTTMSAACWVISVCACDARDDSSVPPPMYRHMPPTRKAHECSFFHSSLPSTSAAQASQTYTSKSPGWTPPTLLKLVLVQFTYKTFACVWWIQFFF